MDLYFFLSENPSSINLNPNHQSPLGVNLPVDQIASLNIAEEDWDDVLEMAEKLVRLFPIPKLH